MLIPENDFKVFIKRNTKSTVVTSYGWAIISTNTECDCDECEEITQIDKSLHRNNRCSIIHNRVICKIGINNENPECKGQYIKQLVYWIIRPLKGIR